ncbi:MAG: endonuclease/exonuclease/phosphatase family protein [Rhizobiaceae bacterium]|nr:endonuclease/exonuclease/phosphatase family protein [Rhizobiaceae bacterium]
MRMLLTLCALGVFILALAVLVAGDRFWALDLVTFFWQVFTLAVLAVLVLSLPLGGMVARLAALAALALCLVPVLTLPAAPDNAPGAKIRLFTANLYVGNPDPRPLVKLLMREQPDIVVTEETRPDFAAAVHDSGLYPFETEVALARADDKKVFSRYPIRDVRQLDDLPGQPVERHAMRLTIETPAGPLVVYAVHPDSPRSLDRWRERNAYFERLTASIRAESKTLPVVVAGDWNLPAHSPFFRQFFTATGYRFARPGLWLSVTRFATRLARIGYFGSTIDHVAVSPAVRVTDWQRGDDIGSNHLPVIVDLALPSTNVLASLGKGGGP